MAHLLICGAAGERGLLPSPSAPVTASRLPAPFYSLRRELPTKSVTPRKKYGSTELQVFRASNGRTWQQVARTSRLGPRFVTADRRKTADREARSALQARKFLFFWQGFFTSVHGGRVNSGCGHIDILGESLVSTCLVAAPPRCATSAGIFVRRHRSGASL